MNAQSPIKAGKSEASAKRPSKGKGGRPSKYSMELADRICGLISQRMPIIKICQQRGMPEPSTIYKWLREHPEFSENYARAKEDQADGLFDECLVIADDPTLEPHDRRVRIDTRKWVAGKLNAKKYGDKVIVGGDADNPIKHEVSPSSRLTDLIEQIAGRTDTQSVDLIDVTPTKQGDCDDPLLKGVSNGGEEDS